MITKRVGRRPSFASVAEGLVGCSRRQTGVVPKRISKSAVLARVRRICLARPGTTERASHGAPTFFVRDKKSFVTYVDDHHGDGRLALWCACPPGMREGLVKASPEAYFVPPYVGYLGWIGVRLDRGSPGMRLSGSSEMRTSRWRQRSFHPASY